MAGVFCSIKVASNAIVLKLEADDKFLEYLKNSIKKSFTEAVVMRRSIFIFSKDGERHRRKVFLMWASNLLSQELQKNKKQLESMLFNSCDLPINIQILSKNAIVNIKKAYAYFEQEALVIKCYGKEAPLFAYIRALLYNKCDIHNALYEIKLSNMDKAALNQVQSIFSKKLTLGFEVFEIVYSKRDFERFFELSPSSNSKVTQFDIATLRRNRMLIILGLNESVSSENIKKRYFELAKKYHPDLNADKSENERAFLSKKFLQIKEAYEILKAS